MPADGYRAGIRRHALVLVAALLAVIACSPRPARTVLLIGGPGVHGAGHHDHAAGIRALRRLLDQDAATRGDLRVVAYPEGWPPAEAFDDAATAVLYFEGDARHPLLDPSRRATFEAAVRRGMGVVALHQASTTTVGDDLGIGHWLGAVRRGLRDRTTEFANLRLTTTAGELGRGLGSSFEYRDEFYPTLERTRGAGRLQPVLRTTLHPQFRDGRRVLEDAAETVDVAWTFVRPGGGRAFAFTGMHFTSVFDVPQLRTLLRNAVLWTAQRPVPATPVPGAAPTSVIGPEQAPDGVPAGSIGFHGGPSHSGWYADARAPGRSSLGPGFGQVWASPRFAVHAGHPPRLYATPLYVGALDIRGGQHRGVRFDAVIAATSNGDVYAVNTRPAGDVAAGRILWRSALGAPCMLAPAPLDGVPTGILSTPVIDRARGRLYVTHCDPVGRWQAYALDLHTGAIMAGWPVRLDEAALNRVNRNRGPEPVAPRRRHDFRVQRGALNLSPDGRWLYVTFGETETGWLVSVDTGRARIGSAFAVAAMPHRGSGGIWGAGGPAVDVDGDVYVATGTGYGGYAEADNDWTQSVLRLAQAPEGLRLVGTYTPFNHCLSAAADIDLGSGGPALLPVAGEAGRRPRLLAVGGKQGNVYLLDRDRLPGALDRRPPCKTRSWQDGSLLPPDAQPQFSARGPLNVFGPYSEADAAMDLARSRSVPAAYVDAAGTLQVLVTGGTRRAEGDATPVAPSIVRLTVAGADGEPPFLRVARRQAAVVMRNPGSPVVTSHGGRDAVAWVLDENAPRSALLAGDGALPRPVLHAFDADSLDLLWTSAPGLLATSGKYNSPSFGGGLVFVGTDRIQAFGAGGRNRPVAAPAASPGPAAPARALTGVSTRQDAAPDAIWRQRCAACHDHASGNIPPRSLLSTRPRARILEALSTGVMRAQAAGLSSTEIAALADYLQ